MEGSGSNRNKISHRTSSNVMHDSKLDASVKTDHAKFLKKLEGRTIHKANHGIQFKNKLGQEFYSFILQLVHTIGFTVGNLWFLSQGG